MTKEEKVIEKQKRAHRRKHKRYLKDQEYFHKAAEIGFSRISIGKKKISGKFFQCEMGYGSCEERGYCNGDC